MVIRVKQLPNSETEITILRAIPCPGIEPKPDGQRELERKLFEARKARRGALAV